MLSERELVSPLNFAKSQSQVCCRVLTLLYCINGDIPSVDLLYVVNVLQSRLIPYSLFLEIIQLFMLNAFNLLFFYCIVAFVYPCICLHLRVYKCLKYINPLKPELNPICYLLALLAHHFLHVSRIRVKSLTIRLLMSYIYKG